MMDRPPVLYKYLDRKGADVFLEKPQLQHREFHTLDDICDSLPAFSTLSEELSLQNAIERVSRNPVTGIPLEKQVAFYKELGMLSPAYLEQKMRKLISKGEGYDHGEMIQHIPEIFLQTRYLAALAGDFGGKVLECGLNHTPLCGSYFAFNFRARLARISNSRHARNPRMGSVIRPQR